MIKSNIPFEIRTVIVCLLKRLLFEGKICLTKEEKIKRYKGGIFLLSDKVKSWFANASMFSSSNLIVLKGNKIVYIKNYESLAENNITSNISSNMMLEIRMLKKERNHKFIDLRNEMIPIFENDKQNYKGQVFLPVWLKNKLKYVLIFYRLSRPYIESSTKIMRTTRMFIPRFIENDRKLKKAV